MHMQNVMAHACRVEADIVFQLGDFGYGWSRPQRKGTGEHYCLFSEQVAKFVKKTENVATGGVIPVYWLGGNHENYDFLERELANGKRLHRNGTWEVAPNVFYVPRGVILTFGSVRFLCCGGGTSIDRNSRVEGESWWPQEAITDDDVVACQRAGEADVLLSHDFPWECEVIDRHLDPWWGEWAQQQVIASRQRISGIAYNANVSRVYHGHLHIRYDEVINLNGKRVRVSGLDCDNTAMSRSTLLIDTENMPV